MAIRKFISDTDVLTAAKQRVKNIWKSVPKLYLMFSCGKDSLCLSSIIYDLIEAGEIDGSKLTVVFIDEEGIYPEMAEAAMRWREKFLRIGIPFEWYCLPFKQVSCIDSLSSSESWITWEPGKEDVWMRQPPPFAITKSSLLKYAGEMNYQTFCMKAFSDGISILGIRVCESYTRLSSIAVMDEEKYTQKKFYPIYDWTDNDVWLYIKERRLDFPECYLHLYEAGVKKNMLRLSAFFGASSIQGLRWIAQTNPELWEKVERRYPNAYLVLLYWDSEMFARSTRKRNKDEKEAEKKDYKAMCADLLFKNTDKYRINHDTLETLGAWRRLYIKADGMAKEKHYKKMFEVILNGDPKHRDYRTLMTQIYTDYAEDTKRENRQKGH